MGIKVEIEANVSLEADGVRIELVGFADHCTKGDAQMRGLNELAEEAVAQAKQPDGSIADCDLFRLRALARALATAADRMMVAVHEAEAAQNGTQQLRVVGGVEG
jgi:regulator of protease activity HflC (stomatin/prohibitin superfamily)